MADNYNILEPVTTPSGTQQRTIRALEISSELYAAAVMHTAGGTEIGHTEDSAHSSTDAGVMALAVRRDTPLSSSGTTGDYSSLNVDDRGRLYTRTTSFSHLRLTSAAPTPTGSDITDETGAAITSDMLAIRSTGPTTKYFFIPFGVAGYTQMTITIGHGSREGVQLGATAFNQAVTGGLYATNGVGTGLEIMFCTGLLTFTASSAQVVVLGSFTGATNTYALSTAGITLATTAISRYNVPELAQPAPYFYWFFGRGGTAPTSGSAIIDITRW